MYNLYKGKVINLVSFKEMFFKKNNCIFFFGINQNFLDILNLNKNIKNFNQSLKINICRFSLLDFFLNKSVNNRDDYKKVRSFFHVFRFYVEFKSVDFFCNLFFENYSLGLPSDFFLLKINSQLIDSLNFKKYSLYLIAFNFKRNKLLISYFFQLNFFKNFLFFLLIFFQQKLLYRFF